jgi:Alpha/beta hydrolase family
MQSRRFSSSPGLLAILLLGGTSCTTFERHFAELTPRDAARIAPYAMMAANAYHNPDKRFPIEDLGWVELNQAEISTRSDAPKYHRFSLAYDVLRNDSRREYAFVFRGTDSYLDFLWANLAVGTSREYGFADREFRAFLQNRPRPYRDYKIVLIGHSLGGGMSLRESVVYGKPAIVFNPSPRLFGPPAPEFKVARRDVVFETGEILAPLRARTSAWYLATKRGDGTVYEESARGRS